MDSSLAVALSVQGVRSISGVLECRSCAKDDKLNIALMTKIKVVPES